MKAGPFIFIHYFLVGMILNNFLANFDVLNRRKKLTNTFLKKVIFSLIRGKSWPQKDWTDRQLLEREEVSGNYCH